MRHESGAYSPIRWFEYAKADLALACIGLPPGVTYELLCFHAQQAAEKAIKAILIYQGIDFPYTHNLQRLIELLPNDMRKSEIIAQISVLNPYAIQTRYPGEIEPVSKEEYDEAVNAASEVVDLAKSIICCG